MTTLEKALAKLTEAGLNADIENDTLYIVVNNYYLELSDSEIDYWAYKGTN